MKVKDLRSLLEQNGIKSKYLVRKGFRNIHNKNQQSIKFEDFNLYFLNPKKISAVLTACSYFKECFSNDEDYSKFVCKKMKDYFNLHCIAIYSWDIKNPELQKLYFGNFVKPIKNPSKQFILVCTESGEVKYGKKSSGELHEISHIHLKNDSGF